MYIISFQWSKTVVIPKSTDFKPINNAYFVNYDAILPVQMNIFICEVLPTDNITNTFMIPSKNQTFSTANPRILFDMNTTITQYDFIFDTLFLGV